MKKRLTFIPALIIIALVLSVFSPALAKPLLPENKLPDPVVTWQSGDFEFTSTFLSIVHLPGTSGADAYLPLGDWPEGEKLFGDKGVALSGFSYGSASICFPFITSTPGWTYAAAMFDGSEWKTLPTSNTVQEETPFSWACTTVYANGTYALLKWWKGESSQSLPQCGYEIGIAGLNGHETHEDEDYFYAVITDLAFYSNMDLSGKPVSITFTGFWESDPVSGFLTYSGSDIYTFNKNIPIKTPKIGIPNYLVITIRFSTCKVIVNLIY